jgi:hypothetical protein
MCFICNLQSLISTFNIGCCNVHHPSHRHFLPVLAHYAFFSSFMASIFCITSLLQTSYQTISKIQNVLTCTSSLPLLRLPYAHVPCYTNTRVQAPKLSKSQLSNSHCSTTSHTLKSPSLYSKHFASTKP